MQVRLEHLVGQPLPRYTAVDLHDLTELAKLDYGRIDRVKSRRVQVLLAQLHILFMKLWATGAATGSAHQEGVDRLLVR